MSPHYLPIRFTGRLVVVLSDEAMQRLAEWSSGTGPLRTLTDLGQLAGELGFPELLDVLGHFESPLTKRVVDGVSIRDLQRMYEIAKEGPFPPAHSLAAYWIVDPGGPEQRISQVEAGLLGVPSAIETVFREQAFGVPPAVHWLSDPFAHSQVHLDPPPAGIDAKWVWDVLNLDGAGIDFVDVEQGWNLTHNDLIAKAPTRLTPATWDNPAWRDHGTAVLGLVAGVDNSEGIVGIAPGVHSVQVASHFDPGGMTTVANAIAIAANALKFGDVLLVEAQADGDWPIEFLATELTAIQTATSNGIIVIEPAGNRGVDLDAWRIPGPDSGAIMVGASVGDKPPLGLVPHERLISSNVGSRINCFASGIGLISAGYGDLFGLTGPANLKYTANFGETSGASAVIAGAALLVQHMRVNACNTRLGPAEMRTLLSQNGTKQGAATGLNNIGVMPDLRRIAGQLVDVYVRDHVGDTGAVPSTGPLSASPDVIVRTAQVINPQAIFGEGSGTENSNTLGQAVIPGGDHYIYVRVRNRGTCPAGGVTATVYFSEVATLVTPSSWLPIGTTAPFAVPAGDVLTVSPAIVWPAAQLPAPGHYCFVTVIDQPYDPQPPPLAPTDWDGFQFYLRHVNNAAWRNFNVLDPAASSQGAGFSLRGAPDQGRLFDFEVIQRLPSGIRLSLEIPLALLAAFRGSFAKTFEAEGEAHWARLTLPREQVVRVPGVRLGPDARYPCRFVLSAEKRSPRGFLDEAFGSFAIRQLFEGREVGRITWVLQPVRDGG
jgi:hypothetical protein